MRDELLAGRAAALEARERPAGRDVLGEEELHPGLGALNDHRRVLGTRLGGTEETYAEELDPADPRAYELAVYGYLTWLQDGLVSAAADAFPSP